MTPNTDKKQLQHTRAFSPPDIVPTACSALDPDRPSAPITALWRYEEAGERDAGSGGRKEGGKGGGRRRKEKRGD